MDIETIYRLYFRDVCLFLQGLTRSETLAEELMQEMRKLMPSPAPKVIVATALARDDFVMRAVELGAKFYLVKPFQPDILLGHIRRLAKGEIGRAHV